MAEYTNLTDILKELSRYAEEVKQEEVERAVDLIISAEKIFVAGAGRSGFAARAFANRLMHLGLSVFFVGEPTTPSVGQGDLLIIGSGSGETKGLAAMAEKAKCAGAGLMTLTIFPDHTIGRMADAVIQVPGVTPKCEDAVVRKSIQPMGSMFEQLCLLIYDGMVLDLMERLGQQEAEMFGRHANLE